MNCPICNKPTETMQNNAKLDGVETDPCFFCGETSHHYINHDFGFDSIEEHIPCGISQLNIDRIKADIVPKIKQACLEYAATLQAELEHTESLHSEQKRQLHDIFEALTPVTLLDESAPNTIKRLRAENTTLQAQISQLFQKIDELHNSFQFFLTKE